MLNYTYSCSQELSKIIQFERVTLKYNFITAGIMKILIKLLYIFPIFVIIPTLFMSSCSKGAIANKESSISEPTLSQETEGTQEPSKTPTREVIPTQSNTPAAIPLCWFSEQIPDEVESEILGENDFSRTIQKQSAELWISQIDTNNTDSSIIYSKLFTLNVPYEVYLTDISSQEISHLLTDENYESEQKVWINHLDYDYLKIMFNSLVLSNIVVSDQIPEDCQEDFCYRISSFDEIEPQWRVLAIDGKNPLHTDFDDKPYPLAYRLQIIVNPKSELASINDVKINPISNFDESQITSLILTGTTALVRNTALMMEENGVLYPSENVASILKAADITHISNEVSFYSDCPSAKPLRKELRFCSDPKYVQLITEIGADVIELTGNHLLDWGPLAFQQTLDLYNSLDIPYYGGGANIDEAQKPLVITVKGNKFAFIGCNVAGPANDWATADRPGALKCEPKQIEDEIASYRSNGYIPIVTIQHYEVEDFSPLKQVKQDFWDYANAGAVIVSGSQAHFPQGFDFVAGSFIHYGVGNLFFDQMDNWLRKATIDIHYFYQGKYLNTESIGIINENFGQPRRMTKEESDKFFEKMFEYSFYYVEDAQ